MHQLMLSKGLDGCKEPSERDGRGLQSDLVLWPAQEQQKLSWPYPPAGQNMERGKQQGVATFAWRLG